MKRTRLKNYIPLLTLPVMLAVCLALWMITGSTPDTRVESATGTWDLRSFDFTRERALVVGAVEYIPHALLTPGQFAARAGDIHTGRPQDTAAYSTSRLRILLPEGQTYQISGRSIDYSERLYVNGKLVLEAGKPGESKETTIPDTVSFSVIAEPVDGEIVIVRQTSNFVHREGGWHDGLYIGYPEAAGIAGESAVTLLMLGCFLVLFLVHLTLYCILRSYRANLYFSLFCLMWLLRTGVTGAKVFSTLLPWLSWTAKFRIEYLALPVTGILIILMIKELFPGVLPAWFRRGIYGLSAIFIGIFLFADTLFMSWVMLGVYAYQVLAVLLLAVFFLRRLRHPSMAQVVSLCGTALFLYSGLRDMFFFSGVVLPPYTEADLSRFAMLFFVFCQMTAMFIGTVHAAEEARAAEQRLIAENAALDRVNRMRNDLTTTVSHEMRTPLAVMSAYAQLSVEAIREGRSDAQTTSNLEMISTEALRLADMATDLLQLSVAQEDDAARIRFDLGGVLRQTAHLCEPMLNKGGNALTLSIADDLPEVCGNAGELTQVLWNLLSNAAAHTKDGEVTVEAEWSNGESSVTVRDTGEGIPPDLLPHVFERRRSGGNGTGVGLAVCREIIEAHGGRITAESEPGRGATITFTIPIGEEEPT